MKQLETTLHALLTRALAGDNRAYREFLGQSAARLRAYFRRRLPADPADIEDLVQEPLLAIHNGRHTYRTGEPVTAWLHAIARYKLVDDLRSRAVRREIDLPFDEDAEATWDDAAPVAAEARRDLRVLLETLPDRMRLRSSTSSSRA